MMTKTTFAEILKAADRLPIEDQVRSPDLVGWVEEQNPIKPSFLHYEIVPRAANLLTFKQFNEELRKIQAIREE